jgi:CxxC motif-containing protein (DUF1111 family)
MSVLNTTSKAALGAKAAKGVAGKPAVVWSSVQAAKPVAKLGRKAGKPIAKRRARKRAGDLGEAARDWAQTLVTYGPSAAQELGLIELPQPKPKRTAPRLVAGIVLGACAVYFLDPEHGSEHREKLKQLVG